MALNERVPAESGRVVRRRCLGGSRLAAVAAMGLSVVLAAALPVLAAEGAPPGKHGGARALPRYRFEEGKRYVYEVRIEATTPDGREVTSGHSHYTVKAVNAASGNMTLSNTGALSTRTGSQSGYGRPFGPRGSPFRQPGGPLAPAETNYGLAREIVVDPTGNVIRSSGHAYLPALLGDLWALVLDPLPPEGKQRWTSSNEVVVVRQSANFPWRLPFATGSETSRPARQTVRYSLGKADGGVVTIEKKYELVTEEKVGEKPYLQQLGEGQIEFDLAAGVPKSLAMKYTIAVQREGRQVEIPVSVSARLLDAAEAEELAGRREAALEAAKAAAKKELDGATLDATLADLRSDDTERILRAAKRLTGAVPDEARRQEVAAALEALLPSPVKYVPGDSAKALAVWGSEANVPALVVALEQGGSVLRRQVFIESLAKLKDPRGAEAIAKHLLTHETRAIAIKALQGMGPTAEGAVVPLLEHGDSGVQVAACQILGTIGTQESAAALEKAESASNKTVAAEAKRALEAVRSRHK